MRASINPATDAAKRRKQDALARWRGAMQAEWKAFAASLPGERFKDRYHRKRDADRPTWKKIVSPVLGILIAVLGFILLPAPGPGIPVVLLGFALVETCSAATSLGCGRCDRIAGVDHRESFVCAADLIPD